MAIPPKKIALLKPEKGAKISLTNDPEKMALTAPTVSEPQQADLSDQDELLEQVDNDLELLQRMLGFFCRD